MKSRSHLVFGDLNGARVLVAVITCGHRRHISGACTVGQVFGTNVGLMCCLLGVSLALHV